MHNALRIILSVLTCLTIFTSQTNAQTSEKSYFFPSIDATITTNKDSSIIVSETQTYAFTGTYHTAWREIPHKRLSAIKVLSVVDADTNTPLTYSRSKLNKDEPASWGKYTTFVQ